MSQSSKDPAEDEDLNFDYGNDEPGSPSGTRFNLFNLSLNKTLSDDLYDDGPDEKWQGRKKKKNKKVKVSRSTYIFAMCAALNSCNLGYDIGVNTSAGKLLQDGDSLGLSDRELELFMGSLNLFAALGAVAASTISDRFGRRGGFIFAAAGFIVGTLLQSLANSWGTLMVGRAFVGLGVGFGLAIDPIYIAEIAPASHRGRLVTWSEIATNVGIVLGFSTGLIFINVEANVAWRLMFGIGMIMPLILIFLVIKVMPESPRWLVSKGREDEAAEVLQKVYPPGYDVQVVLKEIKIAIQRESEADRSMGWEQLLCPTPAIKRMLLVGVGAAIAQQLVGVDAIQYFLVFILEEAGVEDGVGRFLILVGLGLLKLIVIVYAGKYFDKRGRRPLFFISLIGITLSLFLLSVTFVNELNSVIGIIGLACYLTFFSVGMGPGCWLVPSEVFSTSIRAKAMSVAAFMNRATATVVTSTFLSMAELMSWSGYFLMLGFVCIGILIFFYFLLPETNGKSLEEMTVYFAEITGDTTILDIEKRLREEKDEGENQAESRPVGTMT
mmetsp:Transcript_13596/g.16514  ORF Transcript_13596/g.16514 Transcript_13596/m.16514 type:complete len:553 (+) Transcript_13596:181-1839(+)